jgi:glycosyltransferase involved in cell wall biosynthesis
MRLALLSSLFNFPSTGGGIADTIGVGRALQRAGVDVVHVYAVNSDWQTGIVEGPPPFPSVAVAFSDRASLERGVQSALRDVQPDAVMITDAWSSKTVLCQAARDYPTYLRMHAYELICPTNNLRLLPKAGYLTDCPNNALSSPGLCRQCVQSAVAATGGRSLHARDGTLAGADSPRFYAEIHEVLQRARAIFVNNRLAADWLAPYSGKAIVTGAGADPERFLTAQPLPRGSRPIVFMAGGVEDGIKGYDVLLAACNALWQEGHDFELWATARIPATILGGRVRLTGWLEPVVLAAHFATSDICVVPSVVHEAFGIVSAEAMASGKPVVASRAGGLQETVLDGETGFLFERGDARQLATALRTLLYDAGLRARMGAAGRRRFLERYTWDAVVARTFLPTLLADYAGARRR